MSNHNGTYMGGIILTLMLVWPIVVNSQSGQQFIYLGVDWKADNLDGTLFWTAITLMTLLGILGVANQKLQQKENEKLFSKTRSYM